uniref:C-type lectin domain-containing protein n=1 Tax=Oryzias latipes TaxID=8090 RepID=A0A3P9I6S5_ORYLA
LLTVPTFICGYTWISRQILFMEKLQHQLLNWTEAQTFCRQKYTDLATIENSDEMDQLMNTTLSADYTPEFWVGLYSEIKWRWSDGFTGNITDNNYNNWASQDSSNALGGQICMIALWHDVDSTHPQHYHWNDTSCSSLYPFVCNTGKTFTKNIL